MTRDCNRYYAKLRVDGDSISIGSYKTPEEAHAAYSAAKISEVKRVVSLYPQLTEDTKKALLSRVFTE